MMLEVENIHTWYGLSHILFGISFKVEVGEIVCLLGRNGAGKTATLRSIMGLIPPQEGSIKFKEKQITGKQPYKLVREGIAYAPSDRRIFVDLTVSENLELAKRNSKGDRGWNQHKVYRLFPRLKSIKSHKGGNLSGGEQQMLTIARALMGNPEFLLLDEPTEGLAPLMVKVLEDQIRSLREEGLTILLAEQNVKSALRLSDRGYIIDKGQIRYQGSTEKLRENENIRRYLSV